LIGKATKKAAKTTDGQEASETPEEGSKFDNSYLALIKKMKALKAKDSAAEMNIDEINEVIGDLEKEKSDREFEETFNRDREQAASKFDKSKEKAMRLRVHFKRPPKTSEEAIETLQEADLRFEHSKQFLAGSKGLLKPKEAE